MERAKNQPNLLTEKCIYASMKLESNRLLYRLLTRKEPGKTGRVLKYEIYSADYGTIMAGLLLCVIPILILYVILQKQIISGVVAGAVK